MIEPTSETLKFQILLRPEFWDKAPAVEISIDGISKFNDYINKQQVIDFNHKLDFNIPHKISIRRYNKTYDQCQQRDGKFLDQLLHLDKIIIDGIDIQHIVWTQSWNEPEYPEPWASEQRTQGQELLDRVPGETCFGHNGIWHLEFTSPFYRHVMNWMG